MDGQRNVPKNRKHVGSKVPILGSKNSKVREAAGDFGFFTAVYEAYNNHWALRTTPEDWWFTIIRTVALAIDDNSKSPKVRSFFVDHEGKNISVNTDRYIEVINKEGRYHTLGEFGTN